MEQPVVYYYYGIPTVYFNDHWTKTSMLCVFNTVIVFVHVHVNNLNKKYIHNNKQKFTKGAGILQYGLPCTKCSFLCADQKFSHRGPNSFVSIRITSAEIKHNISMVQQEMIKMMPQMAEIIQKPSKLHITLMVLRLQSDEDIETCVTTKLKDYYRFLILYIRTSVLYCLFLVSVYSKSRGRWEVIIDDHLVGYLKEIFYRLAYFNFSRGKFYESSRAII